MHVYSLFLLTWATMPWTLMAEEVYIRQPARSPSTLQRVAKTSSKAGRTSAFSAPGGSKSGTPKPSSTIALNAQATNCFVKLPNNPLTATGLATPFELQAPCSQQVSTQQAFVEAAVFDPNTNTISIYHPLIIDAGKTPPTPPVVPNLPTGAVVALWFGFNGGTLQLLDQNGLDTNTSPVLKGITCVNGLPGTKGDVFGQVSWCNTGPFFSGANQAIAAGKLTIPPLGTDSNGAACPTSRSFKIADACPSDNVPTQYLLLADGTTVQDTAANRAKYPNAQIINNASDESLLANIVDPVIGCKPFLNPSLDNPGAMVPSLAGDELQAGAQQQAPIALVPLNDPDCLLTASGSVSPQKTNAYRSGVNQGLLGTGTGTDNGALVPYCSNLVSVAPPFFNGFKTLFSQQTSPDTGVGNNLFTFLCNRYLMSLTQLTCPPSALTNQPVNCTLDANGAATACTINLNGAAVVSAKTVASKGAATASAKTVSSKAAATVSAGTVPLKGAATGSVKAKPSNAKAAGGKASAKPVVNSSTKNSGKAAVVTAKACTLLPK